MSVWYSFSGNHLSAWNAGLRKRGGPQDSRTADGEFQHGRRRRGPGDDAALRRAGGVRAGDFVRVDSIRADQKDGCTHLDAGGVESHLGNVQNVFIPTGEVS